MSLEILSERRTARRTPIVETPERLSSGNAEADHILGGGFPADSINIIMGHPGSGKTIFAEQLIFHNASSDRPILYFSTLSEPLSKVVRYLQGFAFFDETKVGTQVIYEDIGPQLSRDGAPALNCRKSHRSPNSTAARAAGRGSPKVRFSASACPAA